MIRSGLNIRRRIHSDENGAVTMRKLDIIVCINRWINNIDNSLILVNDDYNYNIIPLILPLIFMEISRILPYCNVMLCDAILAAYIDYCNGLIMIQQLSVSGTHYEVGFAIGKHFAEQIHQSYDAYYLLKDLRVYHETDIGQARYAQLFALHQATYPQYMEELRGMADGANRDFVDMFLLNLRGEYRGFLTEADDVLGCSDCSIVTDDLALIGHNEDGSPAFGEHIAMIRIHVDGETPFTACAYPGFLCGNAFGFNEHGICYSINNVRPTNIRVGIGRHFLARAVLDATSIEDAIERVTPEGRASGFNYNIASVAQRRIVQVEVAPEHHSIQEITQLKFHANHIIDIEGVPQYIDISSSERVACAQAILETTSIKSADDLLTILGDQSYTDYPIYRTATEPDFNETFCTALFDLDARELKVYTGHPVNDPEQVTHFNLA
jgi:predicted choloylglycine hydrolase